MKLFFILTLIAITTFSNEASKKTETLLGEIIIENKAITELKNLNKVDKDKIEQRNSKNLKEAVEEIPSLHFNIGSRAEANFNMRGFTSREIPILINGVPVYMPYNGTMDLFLINTEMIQEIKVKPGISSVLYGPNTMGGAINIITKTPKDGFHLSAWSEIGLNNTYNDGATLSYSKKGGYIIFSPQYWYTKGYSMPNSGDDVVENNALIIDNDTRENSEKIGYSGLLKIGYKNKKSNYELSWFHLNEERGMPIELNNNRARYWKFPEWSKNNLTFISDNKFTKKLSLKNRVFYDSYYNKLEAYKTSDFKTLRFNSIYDDYSYGFVSAPKIEFLEINNLEFSIFYKHDIHREGETGITMSEYQKYQMDTFSIATEYRGEFEIASITAGISYDSNTTNDSNNKLRSLNAINPQIKSTFWIKDNYSIDLSIGKKTRFPTLKELFSGYIDRNVPNPDLNEETTIHYQAKFNANLDFLNANIEFYYSDLTDTIENIVISEAGAPSKLQQLQNIGSSHFIGTELSVSTKKLYNYFSVLASYNYQYSYSDYLAENKVPFQPTNIFKLALTVYLPIDSYIYADFSFIGEQYELDFKDQWQTVPSYALINIKYEQKIYKELVAYFKINNLLNKDYYTQNNFPLAGREFLLGIKYTF